MAVRQSIDLPPFEPGCWGGSKQKDVMENLEAPAGENLGSKGMLLAIAAEWIVPELSLTFLRQDVQWSL